MPDLPLIDADHAAFMQGGVSIIVGSCSAQLVPSLTRAIGCRVSADLHQVTVFVAQSHAAPLLADVAAHGAIATVFSQPSTNRTLQLKGSQAAIGAASREDLARVDAYRDAFVRELEPLGYPPLLVRTLLACAAADILCISFAPNAAFTQTPGPRAGAPLQADR